MIERFFGIKRITLLLFTTPAMRILVQYKGLKVDQIALVTTLEI
jgi:hypothetical protein